MSNIQAHMALAPYSLTPKVSKFIKGPFLIRRDFLPPSIHLFVYFPPLRFYKVTSLPESPEVSKVRNKCQILIPFQAPDPTEGSSQKDVGGGEDCIMWRQAGVFWKEGPWHAVGTVTPWKGHDLLGFFWHFPAHLPSMLPWVWDVRKPQRPGPYNC